MRCRPGNPAQRELRQRTRKQGNLGLQKEFKASLGNSAKPCFKIGEKSWGESAVVP